MLALPRQRKRAMRLIRALERGLSIRDASASSGVCERTIYQYLAGDTQFSRRLQLARSTGRGGPRVPAALCPVCRAAHDSLDELRSETAPPVVRDPGPAAGAPGEPETDAERMARLIRGAPE